MSISHLLNKSFSVLPTSLLLLSLNSQTSYTQSNTDKEKWRLALGGYAINRYDSHIAVSPSNHSASVGFDPEQALGLKNDQTVLRFDGSYRFLDDQTLIFSWYSIESDANRSLSQEIEWVDRNGDSITLPIGSSVNSDFKYDIYKLSYLWSFYQSDKVELAIGGGLHITQVTFGLDASTNNIGATTERVDTSLPLPVFSFSLLYHINENWRWYFSSEMFALSFDDKWEGSYTDSAIMVEYQFSDHWGAGLGIGNNNLRLEEDDKIRIDFDNRITGVQFYVSTFF